MHHLRSAIMKISWETVVAAGGLAFFVLLLYVRLLFTNQVLANGDILHYFYPYRDFAAEAVREGKIPFWNPYIFLGVPFLANPQAAVLYPFHWPLSWLPVTKQIYWSAAFHTWLLGFGGYRLMRHHQRHWGAALVTGLVLAGSGFYGGLIGHINQMNGAAWLPWSILALERQNWRSAVGWLGLCVAFMTLAGHTQTLYINLVGLGLWIVFIELPIEERGFLNRAQLLAYSRNLLPRLVRASLGVLLGVLLSLAQLLPTLELSGLGLRSGGLSYADATSFSLNLLKLPFTLLPSYGLIDLSVTFGTLGYSEFVAYVGLLGLLLAAGALWGGRSRLVYIGLLMAGAGLFLAAGRWNPIYWLLYKVVPGFSLFRTPARWMMLYTLGIALLAGGGFEWLQRQMRQRFTVRTTTVLSTLLILAVGGELILAARSLPHTQTTAPQSVTDVRTAPAHLLTDPQRTQLHPAAAGRFLSMSTLTFDPGDMGDFRRVLVDEAQAPLDAKAFDQLLIALKSQEILAPNLSLLWRIPSVDGFDGGVLPLQRYIQALSLFVPSDDVVPDGRLREQVKQVPSTALLSLLNVQYLFTDKVADLWVDGIYYDRQIGARLGAGEEWLTQVVMTLPYPFEATRLDLIGSIELSDEALARWGNEAISVVEVRGIDAGGGGTYRWSLTAGGGAGADWADGGLDTPLAVSSGAEIAYRDVEGGRQEYIARLASDEPWTPAEITLTLDLPVAVVDSGAVVSIRAATLVDERTGMFLPLLPSDRGNFQLVHSGDVKIYENLDSLPRAYLAYDVEGVANVQEALSRVQTRLAEKPIASQRPWAVVEGADSFQVQPGIVDEVKIIHYEPERVEIVSSAENATLLVLSDSYYPGWRATIDGVSTPILAANGLFRSIELPEGSHQIVFTYQPDRWRWGLYGTMVGILCYIVLLYQLWLSK